MQYGLIYKGTTRNAEIRLKYASGY